MSNDLLFTRLLNALTDYDRKQSTKKYYNPNALGIYMGAFGEVKAEIEKGTDPLKAIHNNFCDRLEAALVKALGKHLGQKLEPIRNTRSWL